MRRFSLPLQWCSKWLLVGALSLAWIGGAQAKPAAPAGRESSHNSSKSGGTSHASRAASAGKHAQAKKRKRRRRQPAELRGFKTRHEPKVEGTPTLALESVDLVHGKATAWVGGVLQAPAARMFVFHDDRERHFIALNARCQPTPPPSAEAASDGTEPGQRCQLDLPPPFLRSDVIGFTVHIRGREIAAAADTVRSRWGEALQALPENPADSAAPAAADLDPRAAQPDAADDEATDEDPAGAATEGTDEAGADETGTGDEGEQADEPPNDPAEGQAPDGADPAD